MYSVQFTVYSILHLARYALIGLSPTTVNLPVLQVKVSHYTTLHCTIALHYITLHLKVILKEFNLSIPWFIRIY